MLQFFLGLCPQHLLHLAGDGKCDDEVNIRDCDFDFGDCCGDSIDKTYCFECQCKHEGNEI